MCKRGDTFSLAILIGRGLDHILNRFYIAAEASRKYYLVLRVQRTAPVSTQVRNAEEINEARRKELSIAMARKPY